MYKKLVWLLFVLLLVSSCGPKKSNYTKVLYPIWGSTCEIIYENNNKVDLLEGLDSIFNELSLSFSNYDSNSMLTKINANQSQQIDKHIYALLETSKKMNAISHGSFDPSIYPIVKLWGFMNKQGNWIDTTKIPEILRHVGLEKWAWNKDSIIRKPEKSMIDFNAIAPGYAADVLALYMDGLGLKNYYINNGGELVLKGNNPKNKSWEIGINSPINQETGDTVFNLSNIALATSGNYRNYFKHQGKKYGHTIAVKDGMPIFSNVLSATIFSKSAAEADALATICMTMTKEQAILFLKENNYKGYLIWDDATGTEILPKSIGIY